MQSTVGVWISSPCLVCVEVSGDGSRICLSSLGTILAGEFVLSLKTVDLFLIETTKSSYHHSV